MRVIAVLSGIAVAILVGTAGLFLLDAVQMRTQVQPQAKLAFDVASAVALGKYGLGMLVLSALAVSGWRASRRQSDRVRKAARVDIPAQLLNRAHVAVE